MNTFSTNEWTRDVEYMGTDEESKFAENGQYRDWYDVITLLPLNIYSEEAAFFINLVINEKCDVFSGGGIFKHCGIYVAINSLGEVCFKIKQTNKMSKYIRNCSKNERFEIVKDRLANEIKKFWKTIDWKQLEMNENSQNIIIKNAKSKNEYVDLQITYEKYRVLYEFFKCRNIDKIKSKYGDETYNSIIGKKIEDQFIVSAINTINNEISQLIKEKNEKFENCDKECYQTTEQIRKMYKEKKDQIKIEIDEKISKLENEKSSIKTMNIMNEQFTF